jgi:hypothetical protein
LTAHHRLNLCQTTIDEQLDAGYVAGVVRGQEQDGLRNFGSFDFETLVSAIHQAIGTPKAPRASKKPRIFAKSGSS